ncbi:lipocalin family protein [Hymenobacter aerophilus]|uniref:lipocalin family protein n=1 Tax=Hymenobacter aerophilus TaxID=119644 RepID=UPI000363B302|nr:lipocalin family protein [Hymenobacter aerophilus]
MKNLLLASLILLFAASGCALKPTRQHDVFNERAELPREEAVHARNSLEWWYFTGHLRDKATGETFGVEYVFFHFNINGKRDWQMVNFALTDPQQKQFRYDYKVTRLPELLPSTLPLNLSARKQNETWTLTGQEGRYHLRGRMAEHTGHAIDLTTTPAKPVLLHNGTGYENYGDVARAGYYSYPRLATTGTLEIGGKVRQVEGELWYDRQWNGTSVMGKNIGWDWFSVQLDEPRTELMAYQLFDRKSDLVVSGGTHYGPDLSSQHLSAADFQLDVLDYWTSPQTKLRYPMKWRLRVPSQGYDLTITPVMPDQELTLKLFAGIKMHYWEGMCRVEGTHHGKPVKGNSYVEITNRGK